MACTRAAHAAARECVGTAVLLQITGAVTATTASAHVMTVGVDQAAATNSGCGVSCAHSSLVQLRPLTHACCRALNSLQPTP